MEMQQLIITLPTNNTGMLPGRVKDTVSYVGVAYIQALAVRGNDAVLMYSRRRYDTYRSAHKVCFNSTSNIYRMIGKEGIYYLFVFASA